MPVDVSAAGVDMLLAARSGDIRVIRSLVQHQRIDMEARDILGDTALLKAARYGHREVVEALLAAGADPNAMDNNGWTSLHISIANNREEVFFTLLSGGHQLAPVNIEAANSNGDTPLHMASYHGQEWGVDTLLRLGADARASNDKKQQPRQVSRHNNVRSMLQSWMSPAQEEAGTVPPADGLVEEAGGRVDEGYGGEGGGRRSSSGAGPRGGETRLRRTEDRQHGNVRSSTNESYDGVADNEYLDRLASGSLVSSLVTTETFEEEGKVDLSEEQEGHVSFEEGSSEGDLSQDSWEVYDAGP